METGRLPPETKVLFLISMLALLLGLSIAIFFETSIAMPFKGNMIIQTLLLSAAALVLSVLFFGYLSPVVAIAIGMIMGPVIAKQPAAALLLLPLALSLKTGATIGILLHKDMTGKENAFAFNKKIIMAIAAIIFLGIILPATIVAITAAIEGDEILPALEALASL
ncbi:MAG: hypothetical protein HY394_01490 [Candidatus Diapherotrites archaeon]|nr:hypothetical protein [Candidatus Diapherotrites archaeon]